ncbi:MAG: TolC family protein [Thermodesulfobacteriota bacterium]|nr:TolC family protein [Thermodesulfobacteriota bacterium]
MKIRHILIFLLILLLAPISVSTAQEKAEHPVVRIGIVKDGPVIRFPDHLETVKQEILALTANQFDVRFPADKTIVADWTMPGIIVAVNQLLIDPDVGLVITVGFRASDHVCSLRELKKPVIAASVVNAEMQQLPRKGSASGVRNLTYISPQRKPGSSLWAFQEIVPFNHLAVLADGLFVETFPKLDRFTRRVLDDLPVEVKIVRAERSAQAVLEALPPKTDGVMVFPLMRFSPGEFQKLVDGLTSRKLPSFSAYGPTEVKQGLLASINSESLIPRRARRIAMNVHRILLGEDAGTLPVAFPSDEQLTINMATARAVGVYPTWRVLIEAELLHEQPGGVERHLSLNSAVREAIAANLDLAVQDRNVAAGKQVVNQARSALLPRMDLDAKGFVIDDDRAMATGGVQPERSVTGSATGTQIIYSEDAWSNFTAEKHFQASREEERETAKLDIILDTAVAYLEVLRAKTIERIQKDNLRLTRANLERARARVSIGMASRAEEFRWESEIATSKQVVLDALARRRESENALNRLLNRPQEERFTTEETDLKDPLLLISDERFHVRMDNPKSLSILRDFLVEQGLAAAPELRRLDAAIEAQKRILLATKRAHWLPTFSLQGNVTELLAEDGEGQRDDGLTGQNDTDWSAGVFATFPLFEGGGKQAATKRALEELFGLRTERQATAEKIEEKIRSSLHQAGASYVSIELSRDAAEASAKNLELVTDSYVRGTVSIIDLIDAQNSALVADQAAENAVYDFLIDLMKVQRATGQFDFFMPREEREAWFQRLEIFFEQAGMAPKRR